MEGRKEPYNDECTTRGDSHPRTAVNRNAHWVLPRATLLILRSVDFPLSLPSTTLSTDPLNRCEPVSRTTPSRTTSTAQMRSPLLFTPRLDSTTSLLPLPYITYHMHALSSPLSHPSLLPPFPSSYPSSPLSPSLLPRFSRSLSYPLSPIAPFLTFSSSLSHRSLRSSGNVIGA